MEFLHTQNKMNTKELFFSLGRPFAPIYSGLMRLREILYQRKILKCYSFSVPVISIGNLTMGGTGKTPVVQYLGKFLKKQGFSPAIVSRGYGGASRNSVNVVSDGKNILMDAWQAGDEPRFLAESLQDVFVLTGKKRFQPIEKAIDMGADIVILDDGFQHMQVERNLNFVLFNTDVLAGNSRVFPGGDLREPISALKRANGFIMTGIRDDNEKQAERFGTLLQSKFIDKPVFYAQYILESVKKDNGCVITDRDEINKLLSQPLLGVCGIANPAIFEKTVQHLKINAQNILNFPDHVKYSKKEIEKSGAEINKSNAAGIITTEKDLVKLSALELPFQASAIRMKVLFEDEFDKAVLKNITF